MDIKKSLLDSWKKPNVITGVLKPISHLYRGAFSLRKQAYETGVFESYRAPIPVIVVGNLTVGGTGKTPLVIHLVEQLKARGLSAGVISRGYSGDAPDYPFEVTSDSDVRHSGDEPALIVKRTAVPMVVGPDRKASIELLLAKHQLDVIISDDGLQHLALQRDIEVCIIDDTSQLENEHLLPAGPYREPLTRLLSVDFIIRHGGEVGNADNQFSMQLIAEKPMPVVEGHDADFPSNQKIQAVAGIGNPQRFFDTCKELNYSFQEHRFADHHHFSANDIDFGDSCVLMTEKDAVKCVEFADHRHWYLPVNAKLSEELINALIAKLNRNFRLPTINK